MRLRSPALAVLLLSALPALPGKDPVEIVARPGIIAPALQSFVDDHSVAGAVTLVADGVKILDLESVGWTDVKGQKQMPKDAMFWIASMTKPMTSVALMMLADEGKLKIEDPVEKYLPEFKGQMLLAEKTAERTTLQKPTRPVTLKDLLTHTSGLVSKSPLDGAQLDQLTLHEATISYGLTPLQAEPGSKWQYCNPGITTLGRIIEVVGGMPYADFMQKRLFDPLKMKDTTFWPNDAQLKRLAKSYKLNADKSALEETPIAYLTEPLSDHKRMPLPAGGLFSTAADLVKFYMMMLDGGVAEGRRMLKKDTWQAMTTLQTGDLKTGFTDGQGWGLGWSIVQKPHGVTEMLSAGSFGHGGAYGTQAWIDPTKKLIFVLLIQNAAIGNSDGSAIRGAFQKAAVDAFGKK